MAVVTFDRGVRSFQRKVSEMVVERVLVQMDNIRVASFMVGMAEFALLFGNIFFQAMKSLFINKVFIHFLVAVPAQLVLNFFLKQGMAFGAIGFNLGVTLNNGAGHHKIFQGACICLGRGKHQ